MKKINLFLALLLVLAVLCGSAMAEEASVNYVNGAEAFVFLPGSSYSGSDMFENFKNCVPGDVRTQEITVRNYTGKQVRIYMKAEPIAEADRAFLEQLHMTVTSKDGVIFEAAPSETAQLTEYVLLGTFKYEGTTDLLVQLTIPVEMGNEHMGAIGTVPWTFMAEELPDDATPHTGDWFSMSTWLAVAAVLLAVIIVLIAVQRKRKAAQ